jgi:hypothetical protein
MDNKIRKLLFEELTVSVEVAGKALTLSKNPAYEACRSGKIPNLRIGKKIRVPTAPLRKMLGLEET